MRIKEEKLREARLLKEGIFDRFVDSLVDSYKRGIENQFIEKSRKANPELAEKTQQVIDILDDVEQILKRMK